MLWFSRENWVCWSTLLFGAKYFHNLHPFFETMNKHKATKNIFKQLAKTYCLPSRRQLHPVWNCTDRDTKGSGCRNTTQQKRIWIPLTEIPLWKHEVQYNQLKDNKCTKLLVTILKQNEEKLRINKTTWIEF